METKKNIIICIVIGIMVGVIVALSIVLVNKEDSAQRDGDLTENAQTTISVGDLPSTNVVERESITNDTEDGAINDDVSDEKQVFSDDYNDERTSNTTNNGDNSQVVDSNVNEVENTELPLSEDTNSTMTDESVLSQTPSNSTNLADMHALVGYNYNFWKDGHGCSDNLGNASYSYRIFCNALARDITYSIDGKYSLLKGRFALDDMDNDIDDGIWIDFYGDGQRIGSTPHLYAGVRPFDYELNISGIKDLRIVANSTAHTKDTFYGESGGILTEGIYVYE